MGKRYFLLLFCCICEIECFAQQSSFIDYLDSVAQVYTKQGQWDSALTVLYKLNALKPFKADYMHHTACVHACKGNTDSAFHYLYKLADSLPDQLYLSEPDFYPLIVSPRWTGLENLYFNTPRNKRSIKDTGYARILLQMIIKDQAYYQEIEREEAAPKSNKEKIKALWSKKEALNKQNLQTLEKMVQSKGWPLLSKVGPALSGAAFLVVQHSDYGTMKKYYHYIKTACETGEGNCGSQALMYDRIKISENKPQRYGSQVHRDEKTKEFVLYPLEDTAQVNDFREYMGLGLLEDYLENWNISLKIPKRRNPLAYADSVVYYQDSGQDPKYPFPHGCEVHNTFEMMPIDPDVVKGKNNKSVLVMPTGSTIILKFIDNQIVNYPYQPDIFVKEEGASGDKAIAYVSQDGIVFDSLGITIGGRTSALDLESIRYQLPVKFIKLVSLDNNGSLPGFDLMHVKGTPLSSVPAKYTQKDIENYLKHARVEEILSAPSPYSDLNAIYFETGKYSIADSVKPYLQTIISALKKNVKLKIELSGFTDDVGSVQANEALALRRAQAVSDYLIAGGIAPDRIRARGLPHLKTNQTHDSEQFRAFNRKVTFQYVFK